jgi:hypothetical protein
MASTHHHDALLDISEFKWDGWECGIRDGLGKNARRIFRTVTVLKVIPAEQKCLNFES